MDPSLSPPSGDSDPVPEYAPYEPLYVGSPREGIMEGAVRIIYGPTGGRFPYMSGLADVIEGELARRGVRIIDRIGVSGGTITATIRSSGRTFQSWMHESAQYREIVSLSSKGVVGTLWSLVRHRGFFSTEDVLDGVFRRIAPRTFDVPCWAVSWCSSAQAGVAFELGREIDPGLGMLASCALPFAFAPVEMKNATLHPDVRHRLGVPAYGTSTFKDGGLCPDFAADLAPLPAGESPTRCPAILVISVEGQPPRAANPFTRLALMAGESKTLYGIEMAARHQPLHVVNAYPSAKVNSFAVRFDLDEDEGMLMYEEGRRDGQRAIKSLPQWIGREPSILPDALPMKDAMDVPPVDGASPELPH
jgi:hypothetical protein